MKKLCHLLLLTVVNIASTASAASLQQVFNNQQNEIVPSGSGGDFYEATLNEEPPFIDNTPSCQLPTIVNGTLTKKNGAQFPRNTVPIGTKVYLTCDLHYAPQGISEATCDASLSWNPTPFGTCEYYDQEYEIILQIAELWPNATVPYVISDLFNATLIPPLKRAMEEISRHTCIKFRDLADGNFDEYVEHYAEFVFDEQFNRCSSSFGLTGSGYTQSIILAKGCFDQPHRLFFTLLSTLGMVQEHRRPDRDSHVAILWQNIADNAKFLFERYDAIDDRLMALPYDYHSVMHFSEGEYAKRPELATIQIQNSTAPLSNYLGNRVPSILDYLKLSNLYCLK